MAKEIIKEKFVKIEDDREYWDDVLKILRDLGTKDGRDICPGDIQVATLVGLVLINRKIDLLFHSHYKEI